MSGSPPLAGIEQAGAEQPLGHDQHQGDGQDRRGQDLHPGGGVERPDEERQTPPGHPGGPQAVDGGDEVDPGQDRREADDEDAEDRQGDVGAGAGAEGDVEGPAGIGRAAAGEERGEDDGGADHVEPPGEQVQAREGDVAGADLDRHDQVAEGTLETGDDEEEDHHHAMHGEERVVGLRAHDGPPRRHQLDAQQQTQQHPDQEEAEGGIEVEQADPLVVGGEYPGGDAGFSGIVPEAAPDGRLFVFSHGHYP